MKKLILTDDQKRWFRDICSGSTSHKFVRLIDIKSEFCFLQVRNPGCWSGGRMLSGSTEYFVAEVGSNLNNIGLGVRPLYQVRGRITKDQKNEVKRKYDLDFIDREFWVSTWNIS